MKAPLATIGSLGRDGKEIGSWKPRTGKLFVPDVQLHILDAPSVGNLPTEAQVRNPSCLSRLWIL
jgi:hypothetical protein